jgi:hypothetical protein
MVEINRTIEELLVDYADALRDGSIPTFLKSLSREEGNSIACSDEFWEGTDIVRVLNGVGFADKAVLPNVSLFTSRVNAEIASRLKKSRGPLRRGGATRTKPVKETEETERAI